LVIIGNLAGWHFGFITALAFWFFISSIWLVAKIHKEKRSQPAR
jgi:hypothetical protein